MAKNAEIEKYPFKEVASVNLKKTFKSWKKLRFDDYKEPVSGWTVKLGKAFEDGTIILLFENLKGKRTPYYRGYIYSLQGEEYHLTEKIRFPGDGCTISAISLATSHDALFCRQYDKNKQEEIFYRKLKTGCKDYSIMTTIPELREELLSPSKCRFALIGKKKVRFIKIDDPYCLTFPDRDEIFGSEDRSWTVTEGKTPEQYISDQETDNKYELDGGFDFDDEAIEETRTMRLDEKMTAQQELDSLIGLVEIKDSIRKIIAYSKMQKLARESGRKLGDINVNIAFTGNPGTAKTTVARLFARIMKENGILSRGELIEAGRADLVAAYVGQTAIKVKKLFDKAEGNVLFIDEAYSLVDSWENEYGDEAIATIIQEMENRKDDLIVIFAGYPDKMETFLSRNPGLRSRIPFVVKFPDYSSEELLQIAKLEAARRGFTIDEGAENRILEIVERVSRKTDFGNGRLCRNLVESAILSAAMKVTGKITDESFCLKESDFEMPGNMETETEKRRIGFSAA